MLIKHLIFLNSLLPRHGEKVPKGRMRGCWFEEKMRCLLKGHWLLASTLIIWSLPAGSAPSSVAQTQNQLKQLDAQINSLRQNLATAHDKRGTLNKELASTERQIGEGFSKLRSIQRNMDNKSHKVADLQQKINGLTQQLSTQQQLLASHIRARYQMGEYQALKWLVNQEDPLKISRILTYYQYTVKSRQQLIDQIDVTRQKITENKNYLNQELAQNQELRQKLSTHQHQLEQDKKYHTTLISSLSNDIETKQHTLHEYQKNKDNLSRLLRQLSEQSIVIATKPFIQMRKKLPRPLQSAQKSLQRMHQGVTFFADEGAVVNAVYPGKIVFSDWLKGYGLLIIIDHGQGFMTLYAHNQSLFKHKGQSVQQHEHIASVGHSGGIKQNGLYFEIRQRGKAVPPLDWLS